MKLLNLFRKRRDDKDVAPQQTELTEGKVACVIPTNEEWVKKHPPTFKVGDLVYVCKRDSNGWEKTLKLGRVTGIERWNLANPSDGLQTQTLNTLRWTYFLVPLTKDQKPLSEDFVPDESFNYPFRGEENHSLTLWRGELQEQSSSSLLSFEKGQRTINYWTLEAKRKRIIQEWEDNSINKK